MGGGGEFSPRRGECWFSPRGGVPPFAKAMGDKQSAAGGGYSPLGGSTSEAGEGGFVPIVLFMRAPEYPRHPPLPRLRWDKPLRGPPPHGGGTCPVPQNKKKNPEWKGFFFSARNK